MLYERSSTTTMSRAPPGAAASSEPRRNGRANAATIIASAATRSINSSQSRMRRFCTDSYGIFLRNISDGNSTTDLRSFCVRWMSTGTASGARPRKNKGVRNDTALPRPRQPLPHRQEPEQRKVERHGGVEQHVVDRLLRRLLRQRVDVRLHQ